jgi:hypothetical protein
MSSRMARTCLYAGTMRDLRLFYATQAVLYSITLGPVRSPPKDNNLSGPRPTVSMLR